MERVYVDKYIFQSPPDALTVVPTQPTLPDGEITNENLVNAYLDYIEVYEDMKYKLEAIGRWNEKARELNSEVQ